MRSDKHRCSVHDGSNDGGILRYRFIRYLQIVSLSGIGKKVSVTRRGIFPCGFKAKYDSDFKPPRDTGEASAIPAFFSRSLYLIIIRTRAPLLDTGVSYNVVCGAM